MTIALVTWFEQLKPGGLRGVIVNTDDVDAEHGLLRGRGLDRDKVRRQVRPLASSDDLPATAVTH